MKDDIVILNTLGRRHLPRLLPVIIGVAVFITVPVMIKRGEGVSLSGHDIGYRLAIIMFAEAFLAWLLLQGPTARHSHYRYTVGMLKVSERRALMLCCVFDVLVFLMIWAVMCCVALIVGRVLEGAGMFGSGPQALFASYMLGGYTQLFVPLDTFAGAAAMVLLMMSLGIYASIAFAVKMKSKTVIIIPFIIGVWFYRISYIMNSGTFSMLVVFAVVLFVISVCWFLYVLSGLSKGVNVEVDDGQ